MPPKGTKGKQPASKASEKDHSNPDKVKSKKESTQQAQNDESEKDKQIKELLLRVDCLEKNFDLKVFQRSSGSSIKEEDQLALWQGAFKSAEHELIILKQGLPSSGDGNVSGRTDEPTQLREKIVTLEIEKSKKDIEIAGIKTERDEANSALDGMRKQLSDNRPSPKESPRNSSSKSQSSDGNTSVKYTSLEKEIQIKDSEIKTLKERITQLESTAIRQGKDSEIKTLKERITQLESTAIRQSKDSEMKIMQEKTTKLESITLAISDPQSYAKLQEEMQSKESEIQVLNDKIAQLKSEAMSDKQSNAELQEKIKELEEKGSEIQRVKEENESQLQRMREKNEAALQRMKEQKDNEERSKQKWMDKVKELEKNTERSKSAKARSEPLQTLLEEKEAEIQNKTGEIESLKREMEGLKKSHHEALTKMSTTKELQEEFKKQLDKKDETIKKLRGEKTMEKTAPSGRDDVGVIKQQLTQATLEIDELKSRLSKMVGENLTNNNPNITDLSDENRPTKLAEIYSEMYDNEWTDAFEELEKQGSKEHSIISELLTILQDTVKFCGKMADQYIEHLQNSASKLHEKTSPTNKFQKMHLLKELRKSYAPSLAGEVFSLYVKEKNLKFGKKTKVEAYTKSCIRLCWLMSVQDPAVVIDEVKTPSKFDGDRYRPYTKSGATMEFVVWPTLLLHAGGPILMKGVAQCK